MAGFTVYLMIVGLASPFVGRAIDRYAASKVIAAGALIAGLGFVLLSRTDYPWHFYLGYAIVGIGFAALGHVSATAVISNWFKKRRGTAIGVMSTGIGTGGLVMAPFVGGYLIPSFGWRAAYLTMGVLVWVLIIPLALLVIKKTPADMGLYPDGEPAPELTAVDALPSLTARGLTLRMALATSAFWLIAISYPVGGFSQVGSLQSLAPYLEDIGFPAAMAAGALGGLGLGSLIGKFFFGWLCDRIPPKYACSIGLGFQAVSIALLRSVGSASPLPLIWANALMLGLGAGSWLPTMSMLISTNFGLVAYGSIYGVINLAQSLGVSTGPLLAGYMFDVTGGYHWAFIIFLALYAVSIPAVLAVRRPKSFKNEVAR
jgi:MFS family permease